MRVFTFFALILATAVSAQPLYSGTTSYVGPAYSVENTASHTSVVGLRSITTGADSFAALWGSATSGHGIYGNTDNGYSAVYGYNSNGPAGAVFVSARGFGIIANGVDGGAIISTNSYRKDAVVAQAVMVDGGSGAAVYALGDRHGLRAKTSGGLSSHSAVYGESTAIGGYFASSGTYGVVASGAFAPGLLGQSSSLYYPGVQGMNSSNGSDADGVLGASIYGHGVVGITSNPSVGSVYGQHTNSGYAVAGYTNSNGIAIYGNNTCNGGSCGGYAGLFTGRVHVNGTLSKSAGSFKIDHPLSPETKLLSHSFVESPDMKNVYDGVATLNSAGEAVVTLPQWFEALNKDFRYQLTPMGRPANLFIKSEIANNAFTISGGFAQQRVSWQVTGIRHDPYAEQNRIPIEEDKSPSELGKFLNPEAYGKSAQFGMRPPTAISPARVLPDLPK